MDRTDGRRTLVRVARPTRRRGRARTAAALAMVALGAIVAAPVSADDAVTTEATASAGATNAITPLGPAAHWVTMSEGAAPTRAAVAANGTTYLASTSELREVHAHANESSTGDEFEGPGTVSGPTPGSPPFVAAGGEESDETMVVAGQVVGSVTIGRETIDGGAGSSFVGRFDYSGDLSWVHVFGPGTTTVRGVEVVGESVVVLGDLDGELDIEGPDASVTGDGDGDAFVLGFDEQNANPLWLDTIDGAGAPGTTVDIVDAGAAPASIAVVARVPGGATVHGAVTTKAIDCPGTSVACDALIAIDGESGEPALATPTGTTSTRTVAVAAASDGFAVLRDDPSAASPPGSGRTTVALLTETGAERWSRGLFGTAATVDGSDIEVDHSGDVVVAVSYTGSVRIGSTSPTTVTDSGTGGVLLLEYGPDGVARNHVPVAGLGAGHHPLVTVAVDPIDAIRLVADSAGAGTTTTTVGSGPAAVTVTGAGTWVASFPADIGAASTFVPMNPLRVLDSRTSNGDWNGPLTAGTPKILYLDWRPDIGYVGFDSTAWVFNVTVTGVTEPTYVTAWPFGQAQPLASNLNLLPGDTRSNQVTVRLGFQRSVQFATAHGSAHVVVDLLGYYEAEGGGSRYHSVAPTRIVDSRTPNTGFSGILQPMGTANVVVAGAGNVPADATAVTLSLTATEAQRDTYLRIDPTGTSGNHSNLGVRAGQTVTNLVTTKIGAGGSITFKNNVGATHVVADVVGYYSKSAGGSWFRPVDPTRVLDSRTGNGGYTTPWGAGTIRSVPVGGSLATTETLTGISGNLTTTGATAMSYASIFAPPPTPTTSNLLFGAGDTIAAAVSSGATPSRTASIFNQLGSAHFVLDLSGYFVARPD